MERSLIAHAPVGVPVKICGFVENLRNKRAMAFMVIRDISGKLQVTLEKEPNPALSAVVDGLTLEAVVEITGTIVENEHVKMGGRELLPDGIRVLSLAEALPMQKDAALDTRMDYRWLDLREERNTLIFKVQTVLSAVMRDYLLQRGFIEIHTPKIIGAASESGADVFELSYFDSKAYLSQSPQFYKQMAMAAGFERVFEVGPVFRAEKSHTNRHATEFTGFDLEFSYIDSYQDVMTLEAELLTAALTEISARFGEDIKRVFGTEVVIPSLPFPQITLAELYRELETRYGFVIDESEKGDLTTEAERLATQYSMEVHGHEFLCVTDFDAEKRAFYHMRENGVPQGYDLLWRGVEITTGAQREHRYDVLCEQAREKGLDEDVKFYLEFFQYGCPPHGGFGIGLDRLTMLLLNVPTIKEIMFLFRGPNRLTP